MVRFYFGETNVVHTKTGDVFELLGNYSDLMPFICLIIVSVSIICMIVFNCAEGAKGKRSGVSAGYGDGGAAGNGWGYNDGHGGGTGHSFGDGVHGGGDGGDGGGFGG